jgi:hypothetical protein
MTELVELGMALQLSESLPVRMLEVSTASNRG